MWHPESIYDAAGHLDEGVLHAWIDGELGADDARAVVAHSEACAPCAARVAEARGFVAGSSRILSALDENVGRLPSAVDRYNMVASRRHSVGAGRPDVSRAPAADGRRQTASRWSTRRLSLAAAAALVFVAGTVVARDGWQAGASHEAMETQTDAYDMATARVGDRALLARTDSAAAPALDAAPRAPEAGTSVAGAANPAAQLAAPAAGTSQPRQEREARRNASRAIENVAAATTEAAGGSPPVMAPATPSGVVPAPAPPAPTPRGGSAAAAPAPSARPPLSSADARLESVVVTGASAAATGAVAAPQSAPGNQGSVPRVLRSRAAESAAAPALSQVVTTASPDAMMSGCWRVANSDSTIRIGNPPTIASLLVGTGAPVAIRLETADSLPVVRFWAVGVPVADSTMRVVVRARLRAVECP